MFSADEVFAAKNRFSLILRSNKKQENKWPRGNEVGASAAMKARSNVAYKKSRLISIASSEDNMASA